MHDYPLTAAQLANALKGRLVAPHKWRALCPAHDDHDPSLAITVSDTGKILLKCWAGCPQEAVISALKARDLWPKRTRESLLPQSFLPRLSPARRRLLERICWFLESDRRATLQAAAIADLEMDVELIDDDASYIVVGQLLEDASAVSYQCLTRVTELLRAKSESTSRHVERWMGERFPAALFGD